MTGEVIQAIYEVHEITVYSIPGVMEKQRKNGSKFLTPTQNPQRQIYQTMYRNQRERYSVN